MSLSIMSTLYNILYLAKKGTISASVANSCTRKVLADAELSCLSLRDDIDDLYLDFSLRKLIKSTDAVTADKTIFAHKFDIFYSAKTPLQKQYSVKIVANIENEQKQKHLFAYSRASQLLPSTSLPEGAPNFIESLDYTMFNLIMDAEHGKLSWEDADHFVKQIYFYKDALNKNGSYPTRRLANRILVGMQSELLDPEKEQSKRSLGGIRNVSNYLYFFFSPHAYLGDYSESCKLASPQILLPQIKHYLNTKEQKSAGSERGQIKALKQKLDSINFMLPSENE